MSESKNIDEKGNISNKFKLAMAFHIWHILDRDEYENSLGYIDQNKWVLFTLIMNGYQKLIRLHKKSAKEVVSEIAWATGYIIPENFDYHFCGYDISVTRHTQQENYLITPNILKNSIDIDLAADNGEHGSVLYELKQLPLSCWLNLKDTIKKYNQTWEEDIRTNLYQWMGLGYQYVLDFFSFINLCAYHQMDTSPLKNVWERYMQPAVQKPLIYIAKDFPEYRAFWESWYNKLYQYAYEMFDLIQTSFSWTTEQMQARKQQLIRTNLWTDFSYGKINLSINKNEIDIDTVRFAEKWLGKTIDSSHAKMEFHGFFTSKRRNSNISSKNTAAPKTSNISMDEIKEIISITSLDSPTEITELPDPQLESSADESPAKKTSKLKDMLKRFFSPKPNTEELSAEPTESPETKRKNQYIETLNQSAENPVFHHEINTTKEHIEQIQSRLQKINAILSEHFTPNEMTYQRFTGIVEEATTRFYANIKTMIKRIRIFDTKDYLKISGKNSDLSLSAKQERLHIYTEHINYVKKLVDANENIISKMDKLLLELTKLDDFSEESLNNNPAINELNDLIEQTKFYKQ